jgi:cytochrome P450
MPGPIVRISPYELHVNDPVFFDTLYRHDAHYDKYAWTMDAFDAKGATLFTVAHGRHKARRSPLNPFWSKAKVASRRAMIHGYMEKFCERISQYADDKTTFDLGAATTALARDVANDYVLSKSYNSLEREDFDVAMLAASAGGGQIWRLGKHVRWVAPILKMIPIPWLVKHAGKDMKIFFKHLLETQEDTKALMAEVTSPTRDEKSPRTIVHEIMESKLPNSERAFERVYEDVSTITGAGFETTASALRLMIYHLFTSPQILQRLRDELASASNPSDLSTLEQLPFLTAILMEGLRLSPAIASRMARIAPASGLKYDQWHIPAGTPVGMTIILIHSNEELYPEPHKFNPDRWMHPDARKKVDKTFVPFSKGTRNCIGMQ